MTLTARRRLPLLLVVVPALAALAALLPGAAMAASTGTAYGAGEHGVVTGTVPLPGMTVVLIEAASGKRQPTRIGSARSGRGGRFTLRYSGAEIPTIKYLLATRPGGAAEAGFPVPGQTYRLGLALGEGAVPHPAAVQITERTTVAMGFAMAQFIGAGDKVAGKNPGLKNAAAMSGDLVKPAGGVSKVLLEFPNGGSTSTHATFNSLGNLLTICRRQDAACARLLAAAGVPGGGGAPDTLAAAVDIARYPWHNARDLYKLALSPAVRTRWQPSLGHGEAPDAWTLALRFEGDPPGLDGPGNFAIDAEGNLWVADNYAYDRDARQPTCGSDKVFRFTPTGQTYPGSPYVGGGLSGVGFGIAIDPSNDVWLGNFGFEGHGCKTPASHYSVSQFSSTGEVLSPQQGWEVGALNWPQGTISDRSGNIWVANCGDNSVTEIPGGNPAAAVNFSQSQITAGSGVPFLLAFGDALTDDGNLFVTGNGSSTVAELGPHGEPLRMIAGGGLHRPLGVATDAKGDAWVANSGVIVAPCVGPSAVPSEPPSAGTVTLIKPDGRVSPGSPISGGGLTHPWGIALDGKEQVWVANFGGRRLSELCGPEPRNCPAGKRRVGAAISPPTGYGFDGLVRNTGVAIDPSGSVWLANNWKNAPIQTNPGGYQIVAYLGLAAPVKSPQFGPPEAP